MRWFKRDRWKAGIALAGMLLLLALWMWLMALVVWAPVSANAYEGVSGLATPATGTVQMTPTVDVTATMTALQEEQLTQQIKQIQLQNDRSIPAWLWNSFAALLAASAVVATVIVNFRQWLGDQRAARDKDLEDRQDERVKQAEERFQKVVEGLGSERTEAKVGAAITLRTFLQPGYEQFYRQTFDLAVAHLRLRKAEASVPEPPSAPIPLDPLSQALITVFKESFPRARDELKKELKKTNAQFDPRLLDATDVRLDNAFLWQANLEQVWMPSASLQNTDLSEANLREARLWDTKLHEAKLRGADLSKADLGHADLSKANLNQTDLRGAILRGAILSNADLSSADLSSADLSSADLSSADLSGAILKGANLSEAIFSSSTKLGDAKYNTQEIQVVDEEGNSVIVLPTKWPQSFNPRDAGAIC